MAITTTSLGIHKPNSAERVNNGWDAISDVADDVNALIVADRARLTALEALNAGARLTGVEGRATALEALTTWTAWDSSAALATPLFWDVIAPGGFRRRGNEVIARGIFGGAYAGNTVYAWNSSAIAAALRPPVTKYFQAAGSHADEYARVIVQSDGFIKITTGIRAPAYVDLSCIHYLTD